MSALIIAQLFGVSNSEVFAVSHAVKLVECSEVRDLGTGVERKVVIFVRAMGSTCGNVQTRTDD